MEAELVAPRVPARRLPLAARAHVSGLAGAVALVGALLFVGIPHLFVQDTWLTLVAGREVLHHGLPTVDHLTIFSAGRTWVDQQWLAQATFYGASVLGGLKAVALIQTLACLTGFALLMRSAYARGASGASVGAVALVAVAAAPWALQLRAQGLGIALFGIVCALLLDDPRAELRRTWIVLPLLCVWANVHGSVVLGALVVTVYGVLTWSRTARAAAFVVLPPLTIFASPYALALPGYYHLMLLNPPFAGLNEEWQRTSPQPVTAVFFGLAVLAAGTLVWRRARFSRLDVAMLAITFASAMLAVRGIVWFGLVCVAVLPPKLSQQRPGRSTKVESLASVGCLTLLILAAVSFFAGRVDANQSAALADAVARSAGATGTVFADDQHADWLLWRVPSLRGRVAYDTRFELLHRAEIEWLSAYVRFRGARWAAVADGFPVVVGDRDHVLRIARARRLDVVFASEDGAVAVAPRAPTD